MMDQEPSPIYQLRSKQLFERYRCQEITFQEYEDQLQQAEEQEVEIQRQRETSRSTWTIQQFELRKREELEKQQKTIEEEEKLDNLKQKELREKELSIEQNRLILAMNAVEERKRLDETRKQEQKRREDKQKMDPILEYKNNEIPQALAEMRKRERENRSSANIAQLAIIVTSTIASGIVNIENIPRIVTSILTILVAIITGIVWIFKYKEKSVNSQQTADAIEYERNLYRLGINDYAGKTPQEAHVLFATRIEDLRHEQNKRQQLLEQTSDQLPKTT